MARRADTTPQRLRRGWVALAALGTALMLAVPEAQGQPKPLDAGAPPAPAGHANIEVWQVEGENADAAVTIDLKLESSLRDKLKQGPFKAFNKYTQLDDKIVPLTMAKPTATQPMKNGATLTLTLKEVSGDRAKLHAAVSGTAGRQPTNVDFTTGPKQYFFLGPFGPKALFLIITVKK